jgi:myosin heavy subunit
MAERGEGDGHARYVRRVSEQLHQYARTLLTENEQLRVAVESLRSERERLKEEASAVQGVWRENDALKEHLRQAEEERERLRGQLEQARHALDTYQRERAQLSNRLDVVDQDNRRFMDQFVALEQQNSNLANLYVASYRLHETLDQREVIAALEEILVNLVGTEELAIYGLNRQARTLSLLASHGIQAEAYRDVAVGEGWIGRVVESGTTFIRQHGEPAPIAREEHLTACVPLKIGARVTGAIAVFRLLPQKPGLEDVDQEIFDLLAAQAATALYCTCLHARLDGQGDCASTLAIP